MSEMTLADTITVFLLDDHEVVRRGVRDLIESDGGISVIGEAATVDEALRRIPALRPQVAVLDVRLPDGTGVEVCREVRSADESIACLMLTSYSDEDAMIDAVIAGASGYVLKQVRGNDLVAAIRQVAAGESLLDPAVAAGVSAQLREAPEHDERLARLSDQERRVLELIAEGMTNRQIATELHLAEKTVKNYVSNLLMKLGMDRRTEAAVFMARLGEEYRYSDPDRSTEG
jgi:two-component system, NarL family, response regulator DevR